MTVAEFIGINLDCPDPPALAEFYATLTGGKVTYSAPEGAAMSVEGGPTMLFQRKENHSPASWPDGEPSKQFHLDFYVDDLDTGEASAVAAGATKVSFQPGDGKWRVMADPAGHLFCICPRS
ncbi:VOC family protein [Streptomyces canus]|uniref:Catechol 2,3-dioxygenase-like lactoylglutathione lyase family enzyme n=1 Tax=Streptomyces canus TaxID=58343 RepID=A0AAW8FQS8_9ACTN|nr:VOC family protein [Streptomyces canus]MDQ0758978.1 catechol 2,3-dioxygenase-like lactoylglutathione lyase family enzyme [Streptomyces canus]MDQ0912406.1 catechol 2,3-dioxygenase-like lactoylglutathione lyase family enzyme [Streptomyces canus]MDQ1072393.1 catechol 2,3-dioxygenase-like lactoylglutathione lyase family enzyme [Streptomyces canus]